MITHINIECIYPHPENPRKDIGDITELSESIKKNGIMQNLTVIPGHYMTDEEWKEGNRKYRENPTEELRHKLNERWVEGGYTLIIGHRRCAAAKAAGLTEVPCKIVEGMSRKEQISTMLEENMQRNDLTIYEQAQGFQLMLDLGETEETISQKTGFSRTTVRRRLNIAKLDSEEVKKKELDDSFQLTLKDLYELEKIKSVEKRNEILKSASNSRDIHWKVQSTLQQEKRDETAAVIYSLLKELGIPKAPKSAENEMYSGKWKTVKEYALSQEPPTSIEFKYTKELYYLKQYSSIKIIKRSAKKEKTKTEAEQNKKKLKDLTAQMKEERRLFVRAIISGEISPLKEDIKDELWSFLVMAGAALYDNCLIGAWTGKESYEVLGEEREECLKEVKGLSVLHQMLVILLEAMDVEVLEWGGHCKESARNVLEKGYGILRKYGWSFSEKEHEKIVDGSSELYERSE